MGIEHEDNLTTEQTAKRIGVSPRTLEKWRMTGEGPAFLPAGKHRVVYPLRWIVEWEEARKATSTAKAKWRRCNHSYDGYDGARVSLFARWIMTFFPLVQDQTV